MMDDTLAEIEAYKLFVLKRAERPLTVEEVTEQVQALSAEERAVAVAAYPGENEDRQTA